MYKDDNLHWITFLIVGVWAFSYYQKRVVGREARKWTSTIAGLVITVLVMRYQSWHHILMIISSIVLIRSAEKRNCHTITLAFLLTYQLVYRLIEPSTRCYARADNIQHMLTIAKLAGVAFDIHLTNRSKDKESEELGKRAKPDAEEPIDPSFMDLFHFVFSFIGMIMGPHLRYRTWDDYLNLPFCNSCDSRALVIKRVFETVLSLIGYQTISYLYPIEYLATAEFASSHFLFKNFFNFIHLVKFKMLVTCGLLMVQCIASIVGLGAYPAHLRSEPCNGPTKNYTHLKNLTQKEADKLEYDFETINTQTLYKIYWTPWHSDFWRYWNTNIQFFLGRYMHKELFKNLSANNRILATMLFSSYWHGLELGYYTSMVLCGVYMVAEKPYHKMYEYTTGWYSAGFLVAMWIIQAHVFSHLWMSFVLLEPETVLLHAAAMNYVPYVSLVLFYLFGKEALPYVQRYYSRDMDTDCKSNGAEKKMYRFTN